ncbi:MAG: flagellin [Porticoccaceae bacterium]|nr:flagellin [Porticoccaceae bacterium]
MATINTNMSAKVAANSLVRNDRTMGATMERLSTGLRINSAKDDAAGLAISSKMTSQIRGLDQAVRNANDAISMIQVAEGAMKEVTNMFQRMRELAVQAISDSNTANDRKALNNEYKQLSAEVQRIGENTQWNGTNILDDSIGTAGVSTFQVGANANQTIDVDFGNLSQNDVSATLTSNTVITLNKVPADGDVLTFKVDDNQFLSIEFASASADIGSLTIKATDSTGASVTAANDDGNAITAAWAVSGKTVTLTTAASGTQVLSDVSVSRGTHAPVAGTDITTRAFATSALSVLDQGIQNVNDTRALLGASMSRLEYASDNLQNVSQNASAARSRVLDADYATETTELARTQIIQQAGTAMLSQANQSQQSVLSLLK